jgi:hypothetical protein
MKKEAGSVRCTTVSGEKLNMLLLLLLLLPQSLPPITIV